MAKGKDHSNRGKILSKKFVLLCLRKEELAPVIQVSGLGQKYE